AFDGNLRKRDLEADTPYNTYTRTGMPPTPIAMPGTRALEAALQPAKSDALSFVARGDGSSVFSSNLDDHNRAVRRPQRGRGAVPGRFITLEGIDGAGKSTHLVWIAEYLGAQGNS